MEQDHLNFNVFVMLYLLFFVFHFFPSCIFSQLSFLNGQSSNIECHLISYMGHFPNPSKHKCSNFIKCMASHLCFNIELPGNQHVK